MPTETSLPLPPIHLMRGVGPTDPVYFENPTRQNVFHAHGQFDYSAVLDFGCGCGRIARQLMQQHQPPASYLGIDLNLEAVVWCAENLSPHNPGFRFSHLNVRNLQFNPNATDWVAPLPARSNSFTLACAHSVFTHIVEKHCEFYLQECARALGAGGDLLSTWFVFDKREFPMMQNFQNALYIQTEDPTNAVIYDRTYLLDLFDRCNLGITEIVPPRVRGYHTLIVAKKGGVTKVKQFPEDTAPTGIMRAPLSSVQDAT